MRVQTVFRLSCWWRGRHRLFWSSLSPGGPPFWTCRCGREWTVYEPGTGRHAELTDDGWEMVGP